MANFHGIRTAFLLINSPLASGSAGKAQSLVRPFGGEAKAFYVAHHVEVSVVVPVTGLIAKTEHEVVSSVLAGVVVETAPVVAGDSVLTVRGIPQGCHNIPMTSWVWDGNAPVGTYDPEYRTVTVKVYGKALEVTTRQKLVAPGLKASVSPDRNMVVFDEAGNCLNEDGLVVLTAETVKGKQFLLLAAAEWARKVRNQRVVYKPSVGYTQEHLELMGEYIRANSQTVTLTHKVERTVFLALQELYGNNPAYRFYADGTVTHTTTAIRGEVVAAVEYSTTFQNVIKSSMLPEMTMVLEGMLPELAQELVLGAKAQAKVADGNAMFDLLEGKASADAHEVSLDAVRGLPIRHAGTDKEVLTSFQRRFGAEVILAWDTHKLYLPLKAVGKLGTFLADGSATGWVVDIIRAVRYLADPNRDLDQATAVMERLFLTVPKAIRTWLVDARKSTASMLRTGEMLSRKVDSTIGADVGLWEIHVNPNDIAAADLAEGETVLAARVPVYTFGALKVVHNEEVPMGVFRVSALAWAAMNSGDSDGDAIYVLPVPAKHQDGLQEKVNSALYGNWKVYFDLAGADPVL